MLNSAPADAVKSLIISLFQRRHGRSLCLFLLMAVVLAVACPALGADGYSNTVTAGEIIRKYWYWLVLIAATLVVVTVTAIFVIKLNRRLKQTQWELKSELGERRRIEETIRRSERRFRDIAETMSDWIWEIDTNCVYTYCSRSVSDIIGYSRKDVIGKTPFDFMIPKDAERLRPYLEEIIRQRCSFRNLENWNITNNGRRVCLLTNGSPIFDDDGELVGYRGIGTDITRRKRAEKELRQAKETAENATVEMAETNKQLETTIERANKMAMAAEMADQTKSEFLANMSHEIRTPLTAILGYTELMMEPEQQPDEQMKRLTIVRRNGEHLLMLINDILDISKIEAGKLVIESRRYSIPPVVSEVLSMMRVRALDKGITLSAEYAGPLPKEITSDEARLRQSLINLVGNAVKFTDTGGVKMIVSFLHEWRDGTPAVEIQVVDTGIGVSPENLDSLFEPFTQADASTSRKYGGTGLGLAITRRIAELMGGELKAESTFGEGSTFMIIVPTGDIEGVEMLEHPAEAVIQQSAGVQMSSDALSGKRILLAEDGEDNMRLIKAILKKAGAEVVGVENGLLAVEQAESQKFDVILMDMQMPEMDGYEATAHLRKNGYTGPIIALTAHAMASDREKCIKAGCDDHLTKPIERTKFIPTIARYAGVVASEQTENEAPTEPPQPAPTPTEAKPENNEVIISELIDDPDLGDIVGDFAEGLSVRLEEMRQSSSNNDHERLQRLSHQLKGAGGSYGYPMLTEAAKALEDAAKTCDIEAENLALSKLTGLTAAVIRGIKNTQAA